jgi:hypothetical protein
MTKVCISGRIHFHVNDADEKRALGKDIEADWGGTKALVQPKSEEGAESAQLNESARLLGLRKWILFESRV